MIILVHYVFILYALGAHIYTILLKILHGSLLLASLGNAALHSSVLLLGLPWDYFHRYGSCNWAKYPSAHSFPCPGIHLRSFVESVPLEAEVSYAQQTFAVISRVCVTLYSFQKVVHRQSTMIRSIGRPIHASQMPGCLASSTEPCLNTSKEVGSWWFECHT